MVAEDPLPLPSAGPDDEFRTVIHFFNGLILTQTNIVKTNFVFFERNKN